MIGFGASRATLKYPDVSSARIWDTTRDNDNGMWRENWRLTGRVDEVASPTVRTVAPATMIVVGRLGIISVVSATEQIQFVATTYDHTLIDILGPLPAATQVVAHAADGMIAARSGTSVYLFDFYTRQIFKITTSGTYLCTPPNNEKWSERWPSEVLTMISSSGLTANATGAIVCSRATSMFDRPVGRPVARPFVFVEAGAYVAGIAPNGVTVRWGQSGWNGVYQLGVLPKGEIFFRGGAAEDSTVACVVKPDNWLWPVGSDTAITNADLTFGAASKVVVPAGSYISGGNDEVGVRNRSNNSLLVADLDLNLGGQRALGAQGTFGMKAPGSLLLMNCTGASPETDEYRGNADFTKVGTPTTTTVKGRRFWGGWSTGNYLTCDYAGGTVNLAVQTFLAGSWSIACQVMRTGTSDDDVILEYAYSPSGYSGHGFRLCIVSDVLRFKVTADGYSGTSVDMAPMSGALPLNVPVSVVFGYEDGIYYMSVDGTLATTTAAQCINANSSLRVGLGVDGARALTAARVSSVCFSKNGTRIAAERCTAENLNTIRESNDATFATGTYDLCGGDDEFGAYYLKNTANLYKVRDGEIISATELRNIGCAGVTNLNLEARGWRIAASLTDAASVPRARLQNASIIFDRSEFENIITSRNNKPTDDWQFEFAMNKADNKVGPRFAVKAGAQCYYDLDILILTKDGTARRWTGTLALRRANSGNAVVTLALTAQGATITDVDITATATTDGAYLTFVHGSASETICKARVNRIDVI